MNEKKQTKRKKIAIWMCVVLWSSICLSGCGKNGKSQDQDLQTTKKEQEENLTGEQENLEKVFHENGYATWVAYWDFDRALEEIDVCGDELTEITAFEALYTGEKDEIWLPDEMSKLISLLKDKYQGKKRIYLSFVNDFRIESDMYLQKDVALLERLISTEENRKRHVKEIIDTVKKYGLDGIELDYENIKRAEYLGNAYGAFIQLLYDECQKEGLHVKVDVEYQTAKKTDLPYGPEYVVMCYNLCGEGTGPGPKANKEFLIACCQNYVTQKNVRMAFSTGGFDWEDEKNVTALTEKEAVELFEKECGSNGVRNRDECSGCVWFSYTQKGKKHEVWYADAVTLNYWKQIVREQGYQKIAIWRMNGNELNTLQELVSE